MASITFWGNYSANYADGASGINHASGSGIGFYGDGYGISVPVGEFQNTTFVTNSNGTATNPIALNNTKYISSGTIESDIGNLTIPNWRLPNYHAPLNIRFTHDEAVKVQNCKIKIFDRNNINNPASGVTTMVYEVRHPHPDSSASGLSFRPTSNNWKKFEFSESAELSCTASPGVSGLNGGNESLPQTSGGYYNWITNAGAVHESSRHDWYFALSASPDSIGSKTQYGLYFTCEYL